MQINMREHKSYKHKSYIMKSRHLSRQLLYVALSRVTKLSNLYISGDFKAPQAPDQDNDVMVEINRLRTEKQLRDSFNTLESNLGLIIVYHNILSYQKYHNHIRNDEWYKQCAVLVLAETQTVPSHEIELPGFELIHRSDLMRSVGSRGILPFHYHFNNLVEHYLRFQMM